MSACCGFAVCFVVVVGVSIAACDGFAGCAFHIALVCDCFCICGCGFSKHAWRLLYLHLPRVSCDNVDENEWSLPHGIFVWKNSRGATQAIDSVQRRGCVGVFILLYALLILVVLFVPATSQNALPVSAFAIVAWVHSYPRLAICTLDALDFEVRHCCCVHKASVNVTGQILLAILPLPASLPLASITLAGVGKSRRATRTLVLRVREADQGRFLR